MKVKNVFDKVVTLFREFGVGGGLLYACDRMLSRVSSNLRVHAYELTVQPIAGAPASPRRASKLRIREVGYDDPAMARMPVRPAVMQARRAQRATCLGAFRNETLVAYMWFCRDTYDEDEVRCTYVLPAGDGCVFDFDFYVFPEHRMGTAFAALWNGATEFLNERGVRETWGRLTRFNLASRRAHGHLGARVAGRAVFIRLGTLEIMCATLAPYVHVSLTRRVRLRLVAAERAALVE